MMTEIEEDDTLLGIEEDGGIEKKCEDGEEGCDEAEAGPNSDPNLSKMLVRSVKHYILIRS